MEIKERDPIFSCDQEIKTSTNFLFTLLITIVQDKPSLEKLQN